MQLVYYYGSQGEEGRPSARRAPSVHLALCSDPVHVLGTMNVDLGVAKALDLVLWEAAVAFAAVLFERMRGQATVANVQAL